MEQEGVLEGAGSVRPDARPASASATSARKWRAARARSACRSSCGAGASPTDADGAPAGDRASSASRSSDSAGEVVARADVISIHLALTKETRGFVNADLLQHAQPGAMLINTARAEVVDYAALAEAIAREGAARRPRRVRQRARRRRRRDSTIRSSPLPGVIGTHHIGASTDQAQEAIAAETVRIVRTFVETGRVPNVVNLAKQTPATHMLVVRHRDKPGVLAHVFERLRDANLNVQETENIIFEGAHAAVARINLDGEPPADRRVQSAIRDRGHQHVRLMHLRSADS